MIPFLFRLRKLVLQILISLDQLAQTLLCGTTYLFGLSPCPAPDETISSLVGRRALDGIRWAKVAQAFINGLFSLLGAKDHCYRSIEILSTKKYPV